MGSTVKKFKGLNVKDKDMKKQRPDRSCKNHGSCPYCKGNRTYSSKHRGQDDGL